MLGLNVKALVVAPTFLVTCSREVIQGCGSIQRQFIPTALDGAVASAKTIAPTLRPVTVTGALTINLRPVTVTGALTINNMKDVTAALRTDVLATAEQNTFYLSTPG